MSNLLKRRISRRDMIKGGLAAAAGAALAACQPKEVEKIVEKEVTREVEQEAEEGGELTLHYLTQLWNWQKLNMATATDQYNMNKRGEVQVEVDPVPEGWDTKVVQMIKEDNLEWDGMLRVRNLGEVRDYVRMGIVQPWDDFINSSSVEWADQFDDHVLANIRDSFSEEGKLYGLPWDIELFCRVYRKDFWDELGEEPAETLEDFENQLLEMKEIFPDKAPFGFNHWTTHPSEQMWIQLWTDENNTGWVREEGLGSMFDVRGEAYKNVLEMWKRWYDTGIITKDSFLQEEWKETWNKGNTTCVQTGAAWAQAQSQKIYGAQNVIPTTNFVLNKGDTPKTFTFANGAILFQKANNPQEITDWLLWMVDPTIEKVENYSFQKGYLNYYHMPAYRPVYENIIPTNPDWAWMEQMLPMVEASQTIPTDAHLDIYGPIAKTWHEKFIFGECSLEECVDAIYEEEREQTEKLVEGEL